MPTTASGIVYPDSDAHTRLWEHFQTLAESVDDALGADSDAGLVSAWTDMDLTPDAGFTVTSARYRVFLGVLVVIDATFNRTGADIVATSVGNMPDTAVAHGVPSAIRPSKSVFLDFMRGTVAGGRLELTSTGQINAVSLAGGATLTSTITTHDLFVRG